MFKSCNRFKSLSCKGCWILNIHPSIPKASKLVKIVLNVVHNLRGYPYSSRLFLLTQAWISLTWDARRSLTIFIAKYPWRYEAFLYWKNCLLCWIPFRVSFWRNSHDRMILWAEEGCDRTFAMQSMQKHTKHHWVTYPSKSSLGSGVANSPGGKCSIPLVEV